MNEHATSHGFTMLAYRNGSVVKEKDFGTQSYIRSRAEEVPSTYAGDMAGTSALQIIEEGREWTLNL